MSLEFDYYSLGDLVKIKYGKNQKKVQDDENGQYPIFGTGGLMGYSIEYLYDKPSVLIGRKGSIEKVRYIEEPFWTVDTLFYTEVNEKVVIPKFLYYVMSLIDLSRYNEGTSIPSLRTETLNRLDLPIPDLDYQNRVLSVLSKIDKKIEINGKINKNLTEISTRQFGHLMNNNIEEYLELKNICKFVKGRKPKEISEQYKSNFSNYLTIEVLSNQNHTYAYDEKGIIANEYDILMVMDGASSGKLFYGKQGLVGSTLAKIDVNNEYLEIIYQFLKFNEKYISDNTTGSAIPHTDKGLVLNLKCPISKKLLDYSEFFKSIRSSIILNNNEIIKLQKLRDTLLPKLMSGEIDVSKINCDLELKYNYMKYLFNQIHKQLSKSVV